MKFAKIAILSLFVCGYTQAQTTFSGIEVIPPSGTNAQIKLRQPSEQTYWGVVLGQSTGMTGYLAASGRDFEITPGWDKTLTLGSPQMSDYGGKVVFPGGNIGIGITSPAARLHITHVSQDAGGNALILGHTTQSNLRLGYHIDYSWVQSHGGKPLILNSLGNNVGIGTTTPDSKLTVKGIIHAEEVKIDLAVPGPDYVFEESYPLLSLEATKNYITENKHLPGIPSSDEMQLNGVNLLEMNMKLLEKVEELTLHLIEMKRENEEQQKQLDKLLTKSGL